MQNVVISRRVNQIVRLGEENCSFWIGTRLDYVALDNRDGRGGSELVGLLALEQSRRIGEINGFLDDLIDNDLLVVAESRDPTSIRTYGRGDK